MFRPRNASKESLKMKIKGKSQAVKPKYLYITFAASLVICTALRFYHSVKLIDAKTGFYETKNFTVTLFYILLIAAGAFMTVASFISANNGKFEAEKTLGKNKPLGIISAALGLSFLTDCLQSMLNALYASRNATIYTDVSYFSQFMKNGYLPNLFVALFSLLTSFYFIKFAKNCLGKCKIASSRVTSLIPVVWALLKLISFFVKQISFVKVSDLLLEIAALIFTSIFLLSLAQCVSGVYADVAQWRLTGVGLTAALLLIMLNFPKFCLTIFGGGSHIVTDYPVNYAELIMGIFILGIVFSLGRSGAKAEAVEISEAVEENNIESDSEDQE